MLIKTCAFLSVMVITVGAITTNASANILRTKSVQQAKSNWCWAAVAEMASDWENSFAGKTQWDIVKHVKGTSLNPYPNYAGSLNDSVQGSEYATNNVATYNFVNYSWSLESIRTMLQTYTNPICAGCGYYVGGVRNGGHMLLIHGIDDSSTLYICDPATGTSQWVSYSYFKDGYGGRKYDQTVFTYFGSVD